MGTCPPGAKSSSWGRWGWLLTHCDVNGLEGVCICLPALVCPLSLLQVDSWALGVLLYTLVYGTMPFDGFDHKNLIRQISSGEYREPTQPSGASRGGSEAEWEWWAHLPWLPLSASVLVSVRSLPLFLPPLQVFAFWQGRLVRLLYPNFPKCAFLHGRQARSPVRLLCELGQIPDPVWIQFLHYKLNIWKRCCLKSLPVHVDIQTTLTRR